tara:strand:+ start:2453 stop:2635 length:183 start_codon:yes stop_codon:yes gene_type:complete
MSRYFSDYIDEYCEYAYGHTNWGYKRAYTEDSLSKNKHLLLEIVFFEEPENEDKDESEVE